MNTTDLTGRTVGRLTVVEDSGERKGGSILWRCRCDCGGEILLTRSRILSGSVTDCGCIPHPKAGSGRAEDLTGRVFGELTVLRRAENSPGGRTVWLCQCSCGKTHEVLAGKLKSGRTRSCGCQKYTTFRGRDLTGQRFGRLVALYPVRRETTSGAIWRCRCACGAETEVISSSLLRGTTRSCGCLNQELRTEMHDHMHYMENTCMERLVRARNTVDENKAGFRGLYQTPSGLYRALITFQKVHYHLGYFSTFEEAVRARLEAEESLHNGFVRAYEQWQTKAAADPEWARQNEFYYKVERVNDEFQITTNEGIRV